MKYVQSYNKVTRYFGVFIVNFEHISPFVLVFLLLTLSRYMQIGKPMGWPSNQVNITLSRKRMTICKTDSVKQKMKLLSSSNISPQHVRRYFQLLQVRVTINLISLSMHIVKSKPIYLFQIMKFGHNIKWEVLGHHITILINSSATIPKDLL